MQRQHVALFEEFRLAGGGRVAIGTGFRQRRLPRPDQDVHAERLAVTGDHRTDPAVAIDAERFAAQRLADADLPLARLQRRHLLRYRTRGGEYQSPGEFGCRIGRRVGVLVRRHHDAEFGAGVDIDVRIDAALADQFQLRQPLQQRRADLRALPDQHQRFGVAQPLRQPIDVLDVVVPDFDIMSGELAETFQRPHGVEIIVEDGNLHETLPLRLLHRQQFDVEHQRGVGWNNPAGAAGAVAERGRNDQGALAADLHGGDAFIPAGDPALLPDRKFERLVAVDGRIEFLAFLAVLIEPAGVMHDAGLAGFWRGPGAAGGVGDLQA